MNQFFTGINKLRENLFFISLVTLVIVFPFSEALVSIFSGFLLLQALLLRSWLHPQSMKGEIAGLFFILSVFCIYIVGTIFSHDFKFALYELRKVIFWLIMPLAFYISPKLPHSKIFTVFKIFIISVTVSSLIYSVNYILIHDSIIDDFRNAGYISHIRFSFQVILALVLLGYFYVNAPESEIRYFRIIIAGLFLWLTSFLFLLQSLIGIISFMGTTIIFLLYYVYKFSLKKFRLFFLLFLLFCILCPVYFTGTVIRDFYSFKAIDISNIEYKTQSGNNYEFDFENFARENGYLVYVYICHDELRNEWNKRSNIKYDDVINGYKLSNTLIRYLTSMGLRKDSAAVSQLDKEDIAMIENGITNYKFKNRFFSIYPRLYQTIWEIDNYLNSGDPNNKSLAQRIEYIKASLMLIGRNPLFGIGTGNWKIKYNEVYDEMHTKLDLDKRASSHNQYLNYLVKFGIFGFLWIMAAILIPFFIGKHHSNIVFSLFMIVFAIANFGDSNLETHMGLSFFTFFYCLFLWHSPDEMKISIHS